MSDVEDEFLGVFGTEFEALQDEQKNSVGRKGAIRPEDQEVTDEQGRRRFHGAFQGGFSAGYYMSVGSKEGWQPREFKSSRVQRAAQQEQTPEDYMDKEDLGEYGIASQRVQTTRDFDDAKSGKQFGLGLKPATGSGGGGSGEKHKLAWEHQTPEADALAQMITPVSDSFGVKLLQRMGWRQGKGVGLDVAQSGKTLQDQQVFAAGPAGQKKAGRVVELPVDDIDLHTFVDKQDTKGLGYEGLKRTQAPDGKYTQMQQVLKTNAKNKKGIRGQAFGVGAFEEEDEDIYTFDSLNNYDYALDNVQKQKEIDRLSEEFVPGTSQSACERQFYAPPKLPRDFYPRRRVAKPAAAGSIAKKTGGVKAEGGEETSDAAAESVMNYLKEADRRRLARIQLQTVEKEEERDKSRRRERKSRFDEKPSDNIKDEPRTPQEPAPPSKSRSEFLAERYGGQTKEVKSEPVAPAAVKTEPSTVPRSSLPNLSSADWDIKAAFAGDADKQKRFIQFVSYVSRGLSYPQPVEQTEREYEAEARLFKQKLPTELRLRLDEQLAARQAAAPLAGRSLAQPFAHLLQQRFQSSNRDVDDQKEEASQATDDRREAVKMEKFGERTRTKLEWHPSKILCKRLNVPDPYPGFDLMGCPALNARKDVDRKAKESLMQVPDGLMDTASELMSRATRDRWQEERTGRAGDRVICRAVRRGGSSSEDEKDDRKQHRDRHWREEKPRATEQASSSSTRPDASVDLQIVERPKMDLFKAIFGDDDASDVEDFSSSSSEDEEESSQQQTADVVMLDETLAAPTTAEAAPVDDSEMKTGEASTGNSSELSELARIKFASAAKPNGQTVDIKDEIDLEPPAPKSKLRIPVPGERPVVHKRIDLTCIDDDEEEDPDAQPLQLSLGPKLTSPPKQVKTEPSTVVLSESDNEDSELAAAPAKVGSPPTAAVPSTSSGVAGKPAAVVKSEVGATPAAAAAADDDDDDSAFGPPLPPPATVTQAAAEPVSESAEAVDVKPELPAPPVVSDPYGPPLPPDLTSGDSQQPVLKRDVSPAAIELSSDSSDDDSDRKKSKKKKKKSSKHAKSHKSSKHSKKKHRSSRDK